MVSHILLIRGILVMFALASIDCTLWSCSKDGKALPVIPSEVAGVWYEIARIPSSVVPACVDVVVPESPSNGNYTLELNYVNNVNKGWKPTKEFLVFPWSEAMNGNFNLLYSNDVMNLSFHFKYLGSMRGYTIVCGYTDISSALSIIRILSRNKLVNSTVKADLDALASRYATLSALTWVQQDGRCNGSGNLSIVHVGLWITLFLFTAIVEMLCFCY